MPTFTDNDISSLSGLTSLRGTILGSGQLLQLAAIAVRDLAVDLPEHDM